MTDLVIHLVRVIKIEKAASPAETEVAAGRRHPVGRRYQNLLDSPFKMPGAALRDPHEGTFTRQASVGQDNHPPIAADPFAPVTPVIDGQFDVVAAPGRRVGRRGLTCLHVTMIHISGRQSQGNKDAWDRCGSGLGERDCFVARFRRRTAT
jgi:hypothetical protein